MFSLLFGVLKAIVSAVFKVVSLLFKVVYSVLAFLHIRLLALYLAVCALLSLFLPVFGEGIAYFWAGLGVCAAITLVGWFVAARRALDARPRKPLREETAAAESAAQPASAAPSQPAPAPVPPPQPAPQRYPVYYDVEGQPGYFFAEYSDRYELYRRGENGAEYIRSDPKR